jgi:hypothetical protein
MYKIPYDASRKSLYHPGEADNFFQFGFALTDEKVLCAEMSRLAYVKEIKRLEAYLERAEFELHWSLGYGKNGTQLFIAKTRPNSKCPPLVIVAFRGTEPDDPSDLLADAILLKKFWLDASGNPLGEVHTGFANALLDDAGNSDILTQLSAQLDDLANQFPRILLTGHSLGAALATLSAGYLSQTPLANNLHIYSFGSPRVGDSVFSERKAKVKHDRYVNYCDLVTCIPSESLGYQHVGTLHHINRHGSVEDSITEADITEGRLKASVAHLMKYCLHKGTVWVRQLSDHSPINYLSSVARYTNFDEVKIEEYPYIHALRKKTTVPKDEGNDKPENLVGIAFSGGGIRSATFGLGVLEALKEKDLLQNIDYLSTVSGGGYVGSWLSANCHRQGNSWIRKDDPEWKESWKESISQLRRNSNYLSPNLSLLSADTWSMGTIWLRNTLLLQLMIVMGIACLLLLPRILSPIILFPGIFPPIIQFGWDTLLYFATFMLSGYLIISIAGNLKSLKLKIEKEDFKDQDLTFLIKHIPPIESGQTKVQLLVIVSMLISLCVSAALWVQTGLHHQELSSFLACIEFITSRGWPLLLLTYAAFVLFSCCSGRNNLYHWLISIPASIVMCLLLATTVYLLSNWVSFTNIGSRLLAFAWAPPLVLFAFSLAIITLIGIQGRGSYESIREWWSRFAAWLAIYGFAWMLIVTIAFYGPLWSERLYYDGSWKTLGTGWIGTTLAGLLAGKSSATGGMESKGITTKLKEIVAKAAPFVFIAGLLIVVSLVLHLVIANFTPSDPPFEASRPALLGTPEEGNKELALQIEEKSNDQIDVVARETSTPAPSPEDKLNYSKHWELLADANYGAVWVVFGVCSLCVGLLGWRIDINVFSLNYFYRNRLSRCFLGASRKPVDRKPHPFTGFDDEDDLELSALLNNKIVPSGPLHIVNCALNLGGSSDLSLHTRHSAIFTFTPLRCGSSYKVKKQNGDIDYSIDYVQTLRYGPQGQPTLGQAISVSGAAASPNMGYHTSAPAAFLMTLFNTRLGWWFPNPSKSNCRMLSPTFSLNYLLQELFGLADEKSDFLAISDGGHFENLAAYELVKRRCKVIIISDGECDPKLQFEGLGTLIRMCEVDSDIGAKIDIDVRSIHPESESVWSRSRCAVGKIKYGKDENGKEIPDGWLIYIKASMNGQEDTTVMQYKATHPTFPHESTGDQFYGEDQFESYRSLGRDITAKLFGKVPIKNRSMDEIAKDLNTIFSPTLPNQAQFTQHADRLMEIWDKIGKNVSLTPLDKELCPLWDGNNPARSIFYLCSEMIQLMENVYMDLDLEDTWEHEDNKGWKELFQQWAKSSNLQATWEHTKSKYGERFQSFWKRNL